MDTQSSMSLRPSEDVAHADCIHLNIVLKAKIKKLIKTIDGKTQHNEYISVDSRACNIFSKYAPIRLTVEMYKRHLEDDTLCAFSLLTDMINQIDFDSHIIDILRTKIYHMK